MSPWDAEGNVYVNDDALVNAQLETIKTALSEALAGLDDPPLIISADAETPHQSVVRINGRRPPVRPGQNHLCHAGTGRG